MPPYTKLPRPEGQIYFSYDPMSPPNWDIVPFETKVPVYANIRIALQALMQAATTIQAQRLERGAVQLLSDHLLFRGQADVTYRLLPTRLRGPAHPPALRQRQSVAAPHKVTFNGVEFPSAVFESGAEDPRNHWGEWSERDEAFRSIEDSMAELHDNELRRRDDIESSALDRASRITEAAQMDAFRKRAAVRHYSGAPSPLLDVSTNPEVAAFFATGGGSHPVPAGRIGLLWAIDLNLLDDLFSLEIASILGGLKTTMTEQRDKWGDNKAMFEEFGVLPTRLEIASVELPFARPQAQQARFFSLAAEDGRNLPLKTELTWWSIIERRAYACAFIHDGHTYENPRHNITTAALLPKDEPLSIALV